MEISSISDAHVLTRNRAERMLSCIIPLDNDSVVNMFNYYGPVGYQWYGHINMGPNGVFPRNCPCMLHIIIPCLIEAYKQVTRSNVRPLICKLPDDFDFTPIIDAFVNAITSKSFVLLASDFDGPCHILESKLIELEQLIPSICIQDLHLHFGHSRNVRARFHSPSPSPVRPPSVAPPASTPAPSAAAAAVVAATEGAAAEGATPNSSFIQQLQGIHSPNPNAGIPMILEDSSVVRNIVFDSPPSSYGPFGPVPASPHTPPAAPPPPSPPPSGKHDISPTPDIPSHAGTATYLSKITARYTAFTAFIQSENEKIRHMLDRAFNMANFIEPKITCYVCQDCHRSNQTIIMQPCGHMACDGCHTDWYKGNDVFGSPNKRICLYCRAEPISEGHLDAYMDDATFTFNGGLICTKNRSHVIEQGKFVTYVGCTHYHCLECAGPLMHPDDPEDSDLRVCPECGITRISICGFIMEGQVSKASTHVSGTQPGPFRRVHYH